jgi:hypothetical protein
VHADHRTAGGRDRVDGRRDPLGQLRALELVQRARIGRRQELRGGAVVDRVVVGGPAGAPAAQDVGEAETAVRYT